MGRGWKCIGEVGSDCYKSGEQRHIRFDPLRTRIGTKILGIGILRWISTRNLMLLFRIGENE